MGRTRFPCIVSKGAVEANHRSGPAASANREDSRHRWLPSPPVLRPTPAGEKNVNQILPTAITVLVAFAIVAYAFLVGLCGNAGFPTCAEHRRNLIASGVNPLLPAILFAAIALVAVVWFMRNQRW